MDGFQPPRRPGDPAPFVRVIDLETSGRDASDGGVVEIGWQDVVLCADGG
ncbi:DNA polymerase III subunit epsilon, partial [Nguyenibacter vanlangensis]|nr:DNA polymerase III subunit epsilon [Nguyenibacter vanlangensis]